MNQVSEKTLNVLVVAALGYPATEQNAEKQVDTRTYQATVDLGKRRSEKFPISVPDHLQILRWQLVPQGQDIILVDRLNEQYVFPQASPEQPLDRQESLTLTRVGRDYALAYQRLK